MSIDSGGGLVDGCLDTVQEIRAIMAAAGKKLYCYVDSKSFSAAYALACAADWIFIPQTGMVGSIGVIHNLIDCTGADRQMGLKYTVVSSGIRKADTNPHIAKTDEVVAAFDEECNALAEEFFKCVAAYRPLSVDQIRGYQAACFHGERAIAAGLADQIATEDEVIALLSSGTFEASRASQPIVEKEAKMPGFAAAMATIQAVVDDENETDENKDKARKMIAACNSAPKAAEDAPAEPHKEPDKDNEGGPSDNDKDNEAKTASRFARLEATTRTALLATRTDFPDATRKTLMSADLATVQEAVTNWPKFSAPSAVADARAALAVHSTTQPDVDGRNALSAYEQETLERLRPTLIDKPFTGLDGFHRVPACTPQKQKELMDRINGRASK
jgi:ClpP class serine protease